MGMLAVVTSYQRGSRGLACCRWYHVAGKGRSTSPPISGGAGLWKVRFWQPALFAVAQGIVKNDPEAIGTADYPANSVGQGFEEMSHNVDS